MLNMDDDIQIFDVEFSYINTSVRPVKFISFSRVDNIIGRFNVCQASHNSWKNASVQLHWYHTLR